MGNLDEDTREWDRQVREGAKKYDDEVGEWWQLDQDDDQEEETSDEDD